MKITQKDRVRRILKDQGFIDNHSAIDAKLTTRLGAIIFQLRQDGMEIEGGFIPGTKNFKYTLLNRPPKMVAIKTPGGVRFIPEHLAEGMIRADL